MQYYHDLVTQKSFALLQQLKRQYDFILIGGWAVFLWTGNLKSKDIDIAVDLSQLEKFKTGFPLSKNERLKKYEIKLAEIDVDIYVSYYSNPGLPAEDLPKYAVAKEGFFVLRPEALLVLKQKAFSERLGTPKGEKDRLDILSLITLPDFDVQSYKSILAGGKQPEFLSRLKELIKQTSQAPELDLNPHQLSRLKKILSDKLNFS